MVIWGGEFGRTSYSQESLVLMIMAGIIILKCFTWIAGGGFKPGKVYGSTDDFGYNITENPVTFTISHATILNLFGIDHEQLTLSFKAEGIDWQMWQAKVVKML